MPTKRIKIKAERCGVGKRLLRRWFDKYNENVRTTPNSDTTWQIVMGRGYLPYARHANRCPKCEAFELQRMERYNA